MMTKDQLDTTLSRTVKKLITQEYFFGCLTMQIGTEWIPADNKKFETAAMCWTGDDYVLAINVGYWEKLSDFDRYCLVKHEILHLAMYHMTEYMTEQKESKDLFNIAADLSVNQYIKDFNKASIATDACTFDNIAKQLNVPVSTFPIDKGLREYYNILKKILKDKQGQGGGQGQGSGGAAGPGNHSEWQKDGSDVEKNLQEQAINGKLLAAEEAANAASADGRGTVPGFLVEILKRLHNPEPPVYNWGAFIRRFVQTKLSTHHISSKHKLNFRYDGYEDFIPGKKKKKESAIMVGIDSSGSVSTKLLEKFSSQLYWISKNSDIDVVVCDTKINDRFRYKKNADLKITGRGGTEFQPVIDEYLANKKKYSCLIYFTDGECPAPTVKFAKETILWVTYGGYYNDELNSVGHQVHIEEKDI